MKTFASVLFVFAMGGIGVALLVLATNGFHQATSFSETLMMAVIPSLLGIVALSGVTVSLAVDEARKDQVARLDRIATLLEEQKDRGAQTR